MLSQDTTLVRLILQKVGDDAVQSRRVLLSLTVSYHVLFLVYFIQGNLFRCSSKKHAELIVLCCCVVRANGVEKYMSKDIL